MAIEKKEFSPKEQLEEWKKSKETKELVKCFKANAGEEKIFVEILKPIIGKSSNKSPI